MERLQLEREKHPKAHKYVRFGRAIEMGLGKYEELKASLSMYDHVCHLRSHWSFAN